MLTTIRSSSKNNSATGTAITVTAPSGVAEGDLVICLVHGNGQTTIVDNNGSTPFSKDLSDYKPNTSHGHTVSVFSRRIQAGDPSSYAFTLGATGRWSITAVAIKNPDPSTIYDVSIGTSNNSDGDTTIIDAPSLTTSTAFDLVITAGFLDDSGSSLSSYPSGYTGLQNTANQPMGVAYRYKVVPGSTGTSRYTFTITGGAIGVSIAIKSKTFVSSTEPYLVDSTRDTEQTSVSSRTLSHTVSTGSNRLLVVTTKTRDATDADMVISGITYNGVAMSKVRSDLGTNVRTEQWLLYAPAEGTHNVIVTFAGTVDRTVIEAHTLFNAAQSGQPDANTGNTGTSTGDTTNITTNSDNCLVIDNLYSKDDPTLRLVDGQVLIGSLATNTNGDDTASSMKTPGAAGVTGMGWTWVNSDAFAHTIVSYAPVTGTTTNSSRAAHTVGKDTSNSARSAKITGKDTSNSSRGARLTGNENTSNSRPAKTTGTDTSSNSRAAHITGKVSSSDVRNARTTGTDTASQSRSAKITGTIDDSSNRSAKITGQDSSSSSRPARMTGTDTDTSARSAKVTGQDTSSSNRSARLTGQSGANDTSDSRSAVITGTDSSSSSRASRLTGKDASSSERSARLTGKIVDPTDVNGLLLWLRASDIVGLSDGDQVTTWVDSSGNGYDATGSGTVKPLFKTDILNGKPAVLFSGSNGFQLAANPDPAESAFDLATYSIYTVARKISGSGATIVSKNTTSTTGGGRRKLQVGINSSLALSSGADGSSISQTMTTTDFNMIGVVARANNDNDLNINGGVNNKTTTLDHTTFNNARLEIGQAFSNGAERLNGYIVEVIIIDHPLSEEERLGLEAYLLTEYFPGESERSAKVTGSIDDSSSRGARMTGKAAGQDSRAAVITGTETTEDSRGAHTLGKDTSNDNRSAKTTGTAQANSNRSAKVTGELSISDERPARMTGQAITSAERLSTITGNATAQDSRNSKVTGQDTSSNTRSSRLTGTANDESNRSAKTTGKSSSNDQRGAKTIGTDTNSSGRGSKVTGQDSTSSNRAAKTTGILRSNASRGARLWGKDFSTPAGGDWYVDDPQTFEESTTGTWYKEPKK